MWSLNTTMFPYVSFTCRVPAVSQHYCVPWVGGEDFEEAEYSGVPSGYCYRTQLEELTWAGEMSDKAVAPPKGEDQGSTRVITVIFLALLIDLLGFTLILPLMPSILDHFGKSNVSSDTLRGLCTWKSAFQGVKHSQKMKIDLSPTGTVISSELHCLQCSWMQFLFYSHVPAVLFMYKHQWGCSVNGQYSMPLHAFDTCFRWFSQN